MRRVPIRLSVVAVVLLGALAVGRSLPTTAQDATPSPTAGHPLVGTWIVDPEVDDPTNPPSFDVYMADGTAINVGSEGATAGAWEATGPRTAAVTFVGLFGGAGSGTSFVIRANVEVDEAGQSFAAPSSFTLVAADGTVLAAARGGTARGTRINAEPAEAVGTPLAGLPTWTPATPEAGTPAP